MAAAAIPYLSVDEYLHSSFEPDADYVDGMLEERNLGELDHAILQTRLAILLSIHALRWQTYAVVEIRVQTSPTRYRVADIGILSASAPREQIVTTPPLLCVEILSPEDRLARSFAKYNDYLSMGVPEVWVFDPVSRVVHVMKPAGSIHTHHEGTLHLENTLVELDIMDVFAALDRP